jgi:hypothetical protein
MEGLKTLRTALAPHSLGPPAIYFGYPVCDPAFIMSQAKGMAFVHLETQRSGESTVIASRRMNGNV